MAEERTQEDIPNHLVDQLRVLLQLNRMEDLPADVVREFWKLQGLFSRCGATVTGHPLALMLYTMGYANGVSTKKEDKSIRNQWKDGEVGVDTPVIVKWKNRKREAVLKNVISGGYVIQIDGEDTERTVAEDTVTLAELATA